MMQTAAVDKECREEEEEAVGANQVPATTTIYYPPTADRILSYTSSPKMKYRERTKEEKAGLVHCPHIKMIVNDVAFLTENASAGDVVIYVGGSIGAYLPLVVKMFPAVQFLVYDGHPESLHYQQVKNEHPPNLHLKPVWFNEQEAIEYTKLRREGAAAADFLQEQLLGYDPGRTLLMVDARNVTRNPGVASSAHHQAAALLAQGPALAPAEAAAAAPDSSTIQTATMMMVNRSTATEDNVLQDMQEQETWVQILRPKSALLKFRLPFEGDASNYSYLKGKMYLQTFAQKSSSEVRLCVHAPPDPFAMYPRALYNAEIHDDCLFYHNCVTRRMHMGSDCRVKVSWDQHASHKVLERWIERALNSDDISGIGISAAGSGARASSLFASDCFVYTHPANAFKLREAFVKERINMIDSFYGRTLGCRVNPVLRQYVAQDNHIRKREIVDRRKQEKAARRSLAAAAAAAQAAGTTTAA